MSGEQTNKRFTAWLSPSEHRAIVEEAKREHTSINYIVRMAIREYLESRLSHVTSEGNGAK